MASVGSDARGESNFVRFVLDSGVFEKREKEKEKKNADREESCPSSRRSHTPPSNRCTCSRVHTGHVEMSRRDSPRGREERCFKRYYLIVVRQFRGWCERWCVQAPWHAPRQLSRNVSFYQNRSPESYRVLVAASYVERE